MMKRNSSIGISRSLKQKYKILSILVSYYIVEVGLKLFVILFIFLCLVDLCIANHCIE